MVLVQGNCQVSKVLVPPGKMGAIKKALAEGKVFLAQNKACILLVDKDNADAALIANPTAQFRRVTIDDFTAIARV